MWIRDAYGKKAWLEEEQAQHLLANGHTLTEWVDEIPATEAPVKKRPGRPRKAKE